MLGVELPHLVCTPPGPVCVRWMERLAAVECPAITARRSGRAAAGARDPIVWAQARGANVVDADGNRYVDLTAGFGVAAVGHAHPRVVEAAQRQLATLVHGMGDLFPTREKILLAERLAALTPGPLQHSIFGCNGADAVEAAIKTAVIATGRPRVLGFSDGYHGLSHGALSVSGYRDGFRAPFAARVAGSDLRLPYGNCGDCALLDTHPGCQLRCLGYTERLLSSVTAGADGVAAVIVEPIQTRGGIVCPPAGWLRRLRDLTSELGVLLIVDEIYTGFGRTGLWFACEREGVIPDILCVGKAMGGGFPVSACIGTPAVMDAWGATRGEAIHTSTFLGNPLGCAMALAAIDALETEGLVGRAAELGERLVTALEQRVGGHRRVAGIRGEGLLVGVELSDEYGDPWAGGGVAAMQGMMERGFLVSPAGARAEVVSWTPPFVITEEQLDAAVEAFGAWLDAVDPGGR
jgi:4-aminobutyrate aminotransferase-like enzyme